MSGVSCRSTMSPWSRATACSRRPGPSVLAMSSRSSALSPGARKRGRLAVTTTGSRTITSDVAWPTASLVQATAMTRTVPLNCGMSKSIVALPSASSFTGPEKKATSFSVGGLPLGGHLGAVAAGAQLAGRAERAVDQAAVEVAQFEAELALAEEPGLRIGRLVVGEVEDADIDRRDHDIGVGRRRQRRSPRPGSTASGAAASCRRCRATRRASWRPDRRSAI